MIEHSFSHPWQEKIQSSRKKGKKKKETVYETNNLIKHTIQPKKHMPVKAYDKQHLPILPRIALGHGETAKHELIFLIKND